MELVEASQSLIDIITRHRDRVIEADLYRDLIATGAVGIIKPDIGYNLLPLTPDQERDVKAMLTECINASDRESRDFLNRLVNPPETVEIQSVLEPSDDAEADEDGWVEVETETNPRRGRVSAIDPEVIRECIANGMTVEEIWHTRYPQYNDRSAFYRICREHGIEWDRKKVRSDAAKRRIHKYNIPENPATKARKDALGDDYTPINRYTKELPFRCEVCGKGYSYATFNKRLGHKGKCHYFCSWGCLRKLEIPYEKEQAEKEARREERRREYSKREATRRTERSRELAAERRITNEET